MKMHRCFKLNNLFLISLILLLHQSGNLILAQNGTGQPISFYASNESLRSVLGRLSTSQSINLTYNASDEVFDKQVSVNAENKRVTSILSELLSQIDHTYQQVGNHFVIIKMPETTRPSPSNKNSPTVFEPLPATPPRADTIIKYVDVPFIIHDTLLIIDTIVKVERELILDTVFVERPSNRSGRIRPFTINNDAFRFEADRNKGWATAFSYAHMAAGYHLVSMNDPLGQYSNIRDAESYSFRSFALGAELQYNSGNFMFMAGISVNSFSNRFYYSELSTSGGFTQTDTLDFFYTIIQNDTIWKYVTDTSWVPLNSIELLYDRMNRIGLLELNASVAWKVYNGDLFSLYLKTAAHTGIPLWLKGNTVLKSEEYQAVKLEKELVAGYVFAYQAGIGGKIQLSDWTDIYAEVFYKRYINEIVIDHALGRRLHGAGLRLGLLYYF
jgi:hypothetical protein